MRIRRQRARVAAMLAAAAGMVALAPAPEASAGGCVGWVCGQVFNDSAWGATAFKDWNCGGTTGFMTDDPWCASGPTQWMAPGGYTPDGQDWDVLRIDAGWCYRVQLYTPTRGTWSETYDRRGTSDGFMKVETFGTAWLKAQASTYCP